MCLSWCGGSIQVTSNAWWDRSHGTPPSKETPQKETPRRPAARHAGIPPAMHAGIASPQRWWSMSGRYASYWNAFLFYFNLAKETSLCIRRCRQKQRTNKGIFRGGQRNRKWAGNGAQLPVWSPQQVIGQRNQKWAGNDRLTFHVHSFKYLQSEMKSNWGFVINSWLSIIVYVHYSRDWIEMSSEPCGTEE